MPSFYSLKQMASISSRQCGHVADFTRQTQKSRTVSPGNVVYTVECAKSSSTNTVVLAMLAEPQGRRLRDGLAKLKPNVRTALFAVADDFPGNGVKGDLTAQVIGGTGLDAMGIGADRRAGLGCMNEFHNKSFGGGRRFTAERFLTASQSHTDRSGAKKLARTRFISGGGFPEGSTILPPSGRGRLSAQPPSQCCAFGFPTWR